MFSNTPLSKAAACKIYCALAERIVGHIFIHTATLQLCRLSRAIVLSNSPHTQTQALASIRQIEINAARGAAQALKLFSEEVIKLDARMRGITGVVTSVVEEVQEHPCLMLGVSLRWRNSRVLSDFILSSSSLPLCAWSSLTRSRSSRMRHAPKRTPSPKLRPRRTSLAAFLPSSARLQVFPCFQCKPKRSETIANADLRSLSIAAKNLPGSLRGGLLFSLRDLVSVDLAYYSL